MKNEVFNALIQLSEWRVEEGKVSCTVAVNGDDSVFEGHFPNQPILPGVIVLESVKRVTQYAVERPLILDKLNFVKFMKPVIPDTGDAIGVEVEFVLVENTVQVKAEMKSELGVYSKVKGVYTLGS